MQRPRGRSVHGVFRKSKKENTSRVEKARGEGWGGVREEAGSRACRTLWAMTGTLI